MLPHVSQYRCKVPWDRRPNESGKAYRAFQAYLSLPLGKRTLIGAYRELKKVDKSLKSGYPPDWTRWKKEHEWDERIAEYDSVINGERLNMLRAVRNEAYDQMSALLSKAVVTLGDLLTDTETPPRVKMDAIFKLFDMVHLTGSGLQDQDRETVKADASSAITVYLPENERLKNQ